VGGSSPAWSAPPNAPASDREEARKEGSVRVEYDVPFTERVDALRSCDLYLPPVADEPSTEKVPVMVVVHGGGWSMGDKWMAGGYGRSFAEAGIAAVVINYRLAPKHKFPAQLDDVRAALLWVQQRSERYGWDPTRIGLFGYSAGAHLCLLVGTLVDEPRGVQQQTSGWSAEDPRWASLPTPSLVVAGGAPCDFRALPPANRTLAYFLGDSRGGAPEVYRCASPATYVSAGDVPTLFFHGSRDLIVPMGDSRSMFARQTAVGVPSRYVEITGHGHLVSFQHPLAKQTTMQFVRERLGSAASP